MPTPDCSTVEPADEGAQLGPASSRRYIMQTFSFVQVSFLPSSLAAWQSAHFCPGYFFSMSSDSFETFVFFPTASVWQATHFAF